MTLWPPTSPNTPAWQRGGWENVVTDHGAVPGSNCTDAFLAAKAALPEGRGVIFAPAAEDAYLVDADALSFDDTQSVRIVGEGGQSSGQQQASVIRVSSNGTYGLSARSAFGFGLQDLALEYASGFTGTLIRFGHSAEALDSQLCVFNRCDLGNGTQQGAACLLNLDKVVNFTSRDCNYKGAQDLIKGRADSNSYANVIRFFGGRMAAADDIAVRNSGQAWLFNGVTFQQLKPAGVNGGAGAYVGDVAPTGLNFMGCWFGDSTATGTWLDFSSASPSGLVVAGNYFGSADVGVKLGTSAQKCLIAGNNFAGTYTTDTITGQDTATNSLILGVGATYDVMRFASTAPTVASAASITLDQSAEVFVISGTTTISTIDTTGWAGKKATLIFGASLTVDDGGGNLILAGNVDFSATSNDTLTLACHGSNWYEVSRSVN